MIFEIIIFLASFICLYHYWAFSYWKRKKVFSISGEPIFGSLRNVLLKKISYIDLLDDIYRNHKSKRIVGFYALYKPMLVLTDTELIKNVLVRDFNSFYDNGFYLEAKVDPMFGNNPFCIKGLERWKASRGIQVPMQTTFKLKEMVPQITKVGQLMTEYILRKLPEPLDVKHLTGMYTVDNVASCAYGLEPNAFADPENGFRKHATKTLFGGTYYNNLAGEFFWKIGELLSLRMVSKEAEDFFIAMVKKTFSFRKKTGTFRNDLIDQLIKVNQKRVEENLPEFTDIELAAHCMTFYLDSYETSSSALTLLLLELSVAPHIQDRLRKEILSAGTEPEHFDFDKVHALNYLDMVLNEGLRKHPVLPVISRVCTKDTELGGIKISKGTKIFIPTASLHKDPELHPEPDVFNPERFSEENLNSIVKYSFIPFGEGPRICAGMKFGQLQLKLALIFLLIKFEIVPESEGSSKTVGYDDSMSFVLVPKKGAKLKFIPLKS